MRKILKVFKWLFITVFAILVLSVLYLRFSRFTDKFIYQIAAGNYDRFSSDINHEEFYFETDNAVKIHSVLFKPDSISPKATIFLHSGAAMTLPRITKMARILTNDGFQLFAYERRGFGKSTGIADNSIEMKEDALKIFDKSLKIKSIKNTPILVMGMSLMSPFATVNVVERSDKINGLILDGAYNSFLGLGKVYAGLFNLEKFKWAAPLLMNNDFPSDKNISKIDKPILIIHSTEDIQIPFWMGKTLYEASNKNKTEFWITNGKHCNTIFEDTSEYLNKVNALLIN